MKSDRISSTYVIVKVSAYQETSSDLRETVVRLVYVKTLYLHTDVFTILCFHFTILRIYVGKIVF